MHRLVLACLPAETATGGVLQKKVFLKISQNSQENTCIGVSSFNKVADLSPVTLFKKLTPVSVFSFFLQNTSRRLCLYPLRLFYMKRSRVTYLWITLCEELKERHWNQKELMWLLYIAICRFESGLKLSFLILI